MSLKIIIETSLMSIDHDKVSTNQELLTRFPTKNIMYATRSITAVDSDNFQQKTDVNHAFNGHLSD